MRAASVRVWRQSCIRAASVCAKVVPVVVVVWQCTLVVHESRSCAYCWPYPWKCTLDVHGSAIRVTCETCTLFVEGVTKHVHVHGNCACCWPCLWMCTLDVHGSRNCAYCWPCPWKCTLGVHGSAIWVICGTCTCICVAMWFCSWSCPWQVQLSLTMSHLIFTFHIGIAFDHAHGSFQVLLIAPRYMVATVVAALPLRGAV